MMRPTLLWELGLGLILGLALGWLGQRRGVFSRGGVGAVVVVHLATYGLAGWTWGALPTVYVLGLILWAGLGTPLKAPLGEGVGARAHHGWNWVISNTGWAAVLAVLHVLVPTSLAVHAAFVGVIAAASADAWATEVGILSVTAPRLILNGRRVKAGTPGGLTWLGLLAALAGAWLSGFLGAFLSALAAWLNNVPWARALLWLPLAASIGGIVGCLVDSFLGATAQGLYYCEHCQQESESAIHSCGRAATQVRGWAWLTNDGVNFCSTVVGAAVAATLLVWLAQSHI